MKCARISNYLAIIVMKILCGSVKNTSNYEIPKFAIVKDKTYKNCRLKLDSMHLIDEDGIIKERHRTGV